MGWSEKDFCIKCDRGGKMLVCSDRSCPIVVHEKCMGCPVKFDDRGKFYCPYCLYRQATLESHRAREDAMFKKQALSSFLDKEIISGDKLVQPSMRKSPAKRADQSSLEENTDVMQSKYNNDSIGNNCDNHLLVVGYHTQSGPIVACGCESSDEQGTTQAFRIVQVGKRMQAEREPVVDDRQLDRDVEDQEDGHSSEIPEREKKIMKKAKQMLAENEPEVDDQHLDRDVGDRQEDGHLSEIPEREKKIRKKAKQMLAENEPEVDDPRLDRDVEDHQEDEHLSEIPEKEKKIRRKTKQMQAENEPKVDDQQLDRDERKENEASDAKAEKIQEKVHQSAASFVSEEPESQLHLKAKRRIETSASTSKETEAVSRRSKRIMKKNEIEDRPLNSDSKRSSRTTYTARKISGLTGEISAPDKLKQAEEYSTWQSPIPNGRRKKLRWSEEEEEMLKEGVHKFSTTANKNIPWRKILEFGRHAFDGTRTPVDLKDKWRTLWAK